MPLGVVVPRTMEEAERAIGICRAEGVPVTPRGGGSSQAGQTVNASVIIDCSKHLNGIIELDVAGRRARVQPGIVLDDLNRQLKQHGLWFPVDVSTASRATIGGMTANNSCGGRSLRYGNTRENVLSIDAVLADGAKAHFGPVAADLSDLPANSPLRPLARDLFALGAREADEIAARFPKVQRRVGGYNIDALVPGTKRRQPRAHPRRLRRHARVLHRDRIEAVAGARPARGRRLPLRLVPRGDGGGAAHRQARRRSRSSLSMRR